MQNLITILLKLKILRQNSNKVKIKGLNMIFFFFLNYLDSNENKSQKRLFLIH